MIIKQLSVFLENRVGRTKEVTSLLANAGVDILAFSTADMIEFGVLRLVVPDVDRAASVLKEAGFATIVTDVVSVSCPNETGALASILAKLADNDISVEYMYALQQGGNARAIIRPSDLDKCVKALGSVDKD
ncbi:MAG: amino acid-binding protein [Bacteroidales bacterium]|nr:amino acid-binding protein [Bacteroidales bacterium]